MTSTIAAQLVRANGVDLCVQTFGEAANPPMLLGGRSMLNWPGAHLERYPCQGHVLRLLSSLLPEADEAIESADRILAQFQPKSDTSM